MAGKKGMKHYSVEVKLEAVRLFYEERKTRAEIVQALGLSGEHRVKKWLWQYRQEGETAFLRPSGRPRKVWNEGVRIRQLEMENALPKKYHTELRRSLLARRNIGSSGTIEENTK